MRYTAHELEKHLSSCLGSTLAKSMWRKAVNIPKIWNHIKVRNPFKSNTVIKILLTYNPIKAHFTHSNILESNCENNPLIPLTTDVCLESQQSKWTERGERAMGQAATLDNQALKPSPISSTVPKRKSQDLCYLMFMEPPPTAPPGKLRTEDTRWFLKTA